MPRGKNCAIIQCVVEKPFKEAVDKLAHENGMTTSRLIRECLRTILDEYDCLPKAIQTKAYLKRVRQKKHIAKN